MTTSDPPSAFVLPLILGVRLVWFEGPASTAVSGSRSVVLFIAGPCLPPNRGVSSSGTGGVVAVIGMESFSHTKSTRRGRRDRKKREREMYT